MTKSEACPIAAHELALYATNDAKLYRQRAQPIILNLARKTVRGVYDVDKALVGWEYLAADAARLYHREFGGGGFSVATRALACVEIAAHYADELAETVAALRAKRAA